MKKLIVVLVVLFATSVWAADVSLKWDPSTGAAGYKVYKSVDNGLTWDAGIDAGAATSFVAAGVPDSGLVLFRVSAYNARGEAIRSWSGAWFCGDWRLDSPAGVGIE